MPCNACPMPPLQVLLSDEAKRVARRRGHTPSPSPLPPGDSPVRDADSAALHSPWRVRWPAASGVCLSICGASYCLPLFASTTFGLISVGVLVPAAPCRPCWAG